MAGYAAEEAIRRAKQSGTWEAIGRADDPEHVSPGVPDEAVEAAAEALVLLNWPDGDWANVSESYRQFWRDKARIILAAALPHLKRM
jgi:hypothetical protein